MSEETNKDEGRSGELDEALQREIDEALGGRSMEDLLEEAEAPALPRTPPARRVAPGAIVPCRVVAVDRDAVLVEMGGKDQGYVPPAQFEQLPQAGDIIQLEVVRFDEGEDLWMLSRQGAVERATWEDLREGAVVEAFVEGANKGGLEVRFGGVRAFMPISHISMYRVEDPAEYVNQKIRCQVIEVDRRERRVIVSARAIMELEAQQRREALLAELKEGDVREGVARQVKPYGVFVDLGGVDGLVHVSQMSYGRVEDPADLVQPGQKLQVKVLKIDRDANKISLGMKQTQPDPWEGVEVKYPLGSVVSGRVTRLESFGAFVQLEPGVEGLIPVGELSWTQRPQHGAAVLQAGQTVGPLVLQIDLQRRRITLSLKQALANPWAGAAHTYPRQSEQTGRVTRLAEFGAFVELAPGVEGLVHISELSDGHVRRVEDVVQVDQTVRVLVLEVDEPNRRISLSMKGTAQQADQAAAEAAPKQPPRKRKRPLRGGLD